MDKKRQPTVEELFLRQLETNEFPEPKREFRFHPKRLWRADFAYPDQKVLVEIEGGAFVRGRHVRGYGYQKDCQKYNNAALLGYTVLRFTSSMVRSGEAMRTVAEMMHQRGGIADGRYDHIMSTLPAPVERRKTGRSKGTSRPRQGKGTRKNT